jgi:hypothetical protein
MRPALRRTRKLTVIVENPYGYNERLDLMVTPGTTAAQLPLDERHSALVQPGGSSLDVGQDLFEVAGDSPRLFALFEPTPVTAAGPIRSLRHVASRSIPA